MKATREQVAALAKESANAAKIYIHEEGDAEFLERLVHLAQQFTLDQLRAHGAVAIVHERVGIKPLGTGPFVQHGDSLYRIPETLE